MYKLLLSFMFVSDIQRSFIEIKLHLLNIFDQ